jgi:SAM-dependent methyltransferase
MNFEPDGELKQNYYGRDLVAKSNWYGGVAQAYDKVRPRYSAELIDFAINSARLSSGDKILEIGCASGIATTSFASRGFNLVSLEPNLEACQLAIDNCAIYPNVEICQTTLEEWTLKPKEFDAVLAATSIHWVSPEIGYPKIAQALKDGGFLILLWNAGLQTNAEINELLKPIYEAYAPSLKPFKARKQEKEELQAIGQMVVNSGYFEPLASTETIIEVNYSFKDYLLLLSTYSPYIALETQQRQNLFAAIEDLQKTCGKQILLSYLSMAQVFNSSKL